jgi:hypothetical protein
MSGGPVLGSEYITSLRDTCATKAHTAIFETLPEKCRIISEMIKVM